MERLFQIAPDYWILINFTEGADLWIFIEFVSHPLVWISPSKASSTLAVSCSFCLISTVSLMQWIRVMFSGMFRWSRSIYELYIMEGRRVNISLGENYKYMLPLPCECCFWPSFLIGMENNSFAKSTTHTKYLRPYQQGKCGWPSSCNHGCYLVELVVV